MNLGYVALDRLALQPQGRGGRDDGGGDGAGGWAVWRSRRCSPSPCRSTPRGSRWPFSCSRRACSGCSICWPSSTWSGRSRRDAAVRIRGARACAAAALTALSLARGAYVMHVEFPERPLFERDVGGDWGRVRRGHGSTPKDSSWLADPAARRALRHQPADGGGARCLRRRHEGRGDWDVRSRRRLPDQGSAEAGRATSAEMSADQLRDVGRDFQLDYLISETEMPMPLVYQSGTHPRLSAALTIPIHR